MTSVPQSSSGSGLGRRTLAVVLVAGSLAAPALLLHAFCVGASCRRQASPEVRAPFCSLDRELRRRITAGYRRERSPDVIAVTDDEVVLNRSVRDQLPLSWPRIGESDRVPLVFEGPGVQAVQIPADTPLSDVAPTAARLIGLQIPHPEVRTGRPIAGVADGTPARLLVLVAWKGVGSADLEAHPQAWPNLRRLLQEGTGTVEARAGSLPLDPAAVLTTIGTGGLPSEHGVTGSVLRNEDGEPVAAWSERAPFSVIAALGDDLDEVMRQEPLVGVVASSPLDRGVIGKDWYLDPDEDDAVVVRGSRRQTQEALELLAAGYGRDRVPDLLAVVLHGGIAPMDRALGEIVRAARAGADGSVAFVVTSTGAVPAGGIRSARVARAVEAEVPDVVEATGSGGIFLDQDVLAATGSSQERVLRTLRRREGSGGSPLFADVFGGRAVEFGRYC